MIPACHGVGRLFTAVALAAGLLAALVVKAANPPVAKVTPERPLNSSAVPENGRSAAEMRLREGSSLSDEVGEFLNTGDRLVFQPRDRQSSLVVLENLALERISSVLEESEATRLWSVSGTVTEFRGTNYLLVTRAFLKANRPAAKPSTSLESPRAARDSSRPPSPPPAGG